MTKPPNTAYLKEQEQSLAAYAAFLRTKPQDSYQALVRIDRTLAEIRRTAMSELQRLEYERNQLARYLEAIPGNRSVERARGQRELEALEARLRRTRAAWAGCRGTDD